MPKAIAFMSLIIIGSVFLCVYKMVNADNWCYDKHGIMIKTSVGQVCIREDVIIKE